MRKIINPLTGCLYSFLHVTFGSVWHLFLFIFALVMIPFTESGNAPSDGKKE